MRPNQLSPGALRAGERIYAVLKRHLPLLQEKTAETLAAIVDKETAAPKLLHVCELVAQQHRLVGCNGGNGCILCNAAQAAISEHVLGDYLRNGLAEEFIKLCGE